MPCPLPLHHHATASLRHCISQSFALPPATKPVHHLPCPLPPNQSVICLAPYHRITASPCHRITASPRHCISRSFALPPATKPVSHLPAPCHQTSQSFALPPTTASPHHHVTASPHHRITALVSHLPCPLPPNQSVICLAPCHQTSQSFALPPTTASPHHRITASPRHRVTALVSHLPCPLPPNQSVICLAPCHQTSQSFALPPTTVSPHHRITTSPRHHVTASLGHHVTALVSHLPCPLPPNQSVICLAPFHQTSQSFALPPTTVSLRHCATTSPHHRVTALVSHLPCPLPPNQSVICLAPYHHVTASLHHRVTVPPRHRITTSLH